jgi:hypothetical protein
MATLVIFHKDTDEILYAQGVYRETSDPDEKAAIIFDVENISDPENYVARMIPADMSQTEFMYSMLVVDGIITEKTDMGCTPDKMTVMADGVDYVTISNMPVPCTVSVQDETLEVTEGEVELTFDLPGKYEVKVSSRAHFDWKVKINAT